MVKQPVYYVQKSYRNEDGKPSTKYVERLGTLEDLEKRFGEEDPIGEAKKYVAELTAQEKENRPNPIVQMGLFTDMDGIPLAFCVNPGNTAETFSFKYRDYLRHIRGKQIARAEQSIKNGTAGKLGKGQNDPKRFFKCEKCTMDGEFAQYSSYALNQEMIDQESRFDGFYGICTDLWDDAPEIIKVNGGRWIIEDCFRLTKTEFEARPVFLRRDDRITAHFLTCFLALIIYKYLAKKVNRAGEKFSPDQIIGTLQDMNFLNVTGEGYIPTYTRTDLTNHLHGSAGFRTDTQIVTKKAMKSIIASIKTSNDEV